MRDGVQGRTQPRQEAVFPAAAGPAARPSLGPGGPTRVSWGGVSTERPSSLPFSPSLWPALVTRVHLSHITMAGINLLMFSRGFEDAKCYYYNCYIKFLRERKGSLNSLCFTFSCVVEFVRLHKA